MPPGRLVKFVGTILFSAMLVGCGTNTILTPITTPGAPTTGNLITIATDVPVCDAITAAVVVEDLNFTTAQGGSIAHYLNTTSSFAPEIRLNLSQLRDFDTILYSFPMNAGSYNQANIAFLIAQVAAFDPTLNPPVHTFNPAFENAMPVVPINPPMQIIAGKANVILLDFDVRRMLDTDNTGNLTGKINPVLNITQLTAISPSGAVNPNGFAEIDDLWGFVRSVSNTNTTANSNYIGDFQLQVLSPSVADAPEVPINLTATTNKIGFADLGHLLPNSYVEADVTIDPDGNFMGNTVEVQAVESPFPTQTGVTPSTAMIGPIVSIQTDSSGIPKQLNLWARDLEPDDMVPSRMTQFSRVILPTDHPTRLRPLDPTSRILPLGPRTCR